MTTIVYTLGNGYRCSCCSQTWNEEEDFYEDDSDDVIIKRMAHIGSRAEDWCGIHRIYNYRGDTDELESRIEKQISRSIEILKKEKEIKSKSNDIAEIDKWFASLDALKERKSANRIKFHSELIELQKQLNTLTGE